MDAPCLQSAQAAETTCETTLGTFILHQPMSITPSRSHTNSNKKQSNDQNSHCSSPSYFFLPAKSESPSSPKLFDELIEQILSWIHPSNVIRFRALSRVMDARITSSLHFARLNLTRFLELPLARAASYTQSDMDKLFWNHWPKNYQRIYATVYLNTTYKIQWNHLITESTIPPLIGLMQTLSHLDLTDSNLIGSIPEPLYTLINLKFLSLAVNKLSGTISPDIGNLKNLTHLYLETNNFSGTIPTTIGNLHKLEYLYLHSSPQLTGPIPEALSNCTLLQRLTLRDNALTGQIPPSLFRNCRNLHLVYLYGNRLTGPIPREIGTSGGLTQLKLNGNLLWGDVPRELLVMVPQMVECDLRFNQLTVSEESREGIVLGPVFQI
ncbi:L domain-like protein [Rhizoclosmatium globosum]|uniref:L domain-like protein n=1 Tax=Rhizoclosmatium globosum TaxID=329046 RepID=A0A1Y2BQS0_9FUNG|nr:L domain-like protein [Rhizoclosmatium globosum]|eukprot:ORY37099.1 L domain-like protein [Rhizoclosmatium globosum]